MLSIVITWCDRDELAQALPSMVEVAQALGGEITIVNFGGDKTKLGAMLAEYSGQVQVVDVDQQAYFNKSCAQNLGAAHSSHPFLFFCDCDIILDTTVISELLQSLQENPDTFATLAYVQETELPSPNREDQIVGLGYELYVKLRNGQELKILHRWEDAEKGLRKAPGLLMVRKEHFLSMAGYNSGFEGWGWEAQDIISRLVLGAGLTRIESGQATHLTHNEQSRIVNSRNADRWDNRDKMFREALQNYNVGNFSGTFHQDVEAFKDLMTHSIYQAPKL